MLESLERIEAKYKTINEQLCDPKIISDTNKLKALSKERSDLEEIVGLADRYHNIQRNLEEAEKMIGMEEDPEMRSFLEDEKREMEREFEELETSIMYSMLPKDPYADKNIIMEIRQGAGGEEAALFGYNLMRMYMKYAEQNSFKTEILDIHETELGGIKEVSLAIKGKKAYARFKFESGVHRVQRVPDTEASGRIHTSTATVAVLPEAEDVDIEIKEDDLRIDTYCSSSAGGQHVNRTESAIRITHTPSGIVVTCQDERSQRQNREKAMRMLRSKLLEIAIREQEEAIASSRKLQVGTGARSEKIRTYNYPQSRITDHRIGFTSHNLEGIMEGNLSDLFKALEEAEKEELLAEVGK